ncbi:RNA-binding cell elongation regulator Jag/EloR [Candidatus Contubernalis alkaliaceticus]|uniref:RNA-binding cell elongation regulator Jag/EloR n=1 Tax=Candidatus Contubernalis alkaliaceticus TaxID=338645 RepID=UPI001F4C04C0|nr:RNA-binding cell elongation regulator Jag/EloR [Candidatus Contubernalis alkalaceticus]UNC93729.1 protein jag [Candidatus Contubernalis alkalaceticus]
MKTVENTGKTIEEAIELGLEQLGIKRENAEIEILSEPSQGFFGLIGARAAKVRISVKKLPAEYARDFIYELTKKMGLDNVKVEIEKQNENTVYLEIVGDNLGILIGKRGQTLNSMQYLTNLVVNRQFNEFTRVMIDIEKYRQRREKTLRMLAENLAHKVTRGKRNIVLEPMIPQERRIIHTALQNNSYVSTYSQGDEPFRKVVITLRRTGENTSSK